MRALVWAEGAAATSRTLGLSQAVIEDLASGSTFTERMAKRLATAAEGAPPVRCAVCGAELTAANTPDRCVVLGQLRCTRCR